jgi:hypothetical protein
VVKFHVMVCGVKIPCSLVGGCNGLEELSVHIIHDGSNGRSFSPKRFSLLRDQMP